MNESVKVSVLIAAYNTEKYIDQCLESVMNQTLREIEIIVVDDCSTDATLAHIEAAAERDSRVRVIRHEVNRGTHMARKNAVLASHGEYIMFVDSDDWIEPNAAEQLYIKMQKTGVDILHFGTFVDNCANYSSNTVSLVQKYVAPYMGGILTESLITEAFVKNRFQNYPWVKIYRGELLRSVFAEMDDGYYIYAEDIYQTFCLLLRAKSYLGIEDRFYHYCRGRGITGRNKDVLTLQNFCKYCNAINVWRAIQRRAEKWEKEANEEERRLIPPQSVVMAVTALRQKFINDLLNQVITKMKPEDQPEGFLMMEQAWQMDKPDFMGMLEQTGKQRQQQIVEALTNAEYMRCQKRKIKTIAFYYIKFSNGGTERVMACLCNLFAELKDENGNPRLKVILITDEPPREEDYPLSPLVTREQIPADKESKSHYAPRAAAWNRVIEENEIDMIVYPNWRLESQFIDFLTIKRTQRKPALVLHVHTWSAYFYQNNHEVEELKKLARISDGIVTLSEADRLYWSRCNPRSVYIPNPCFVKASECRRSAYSKHILWLGRIASGKQPLEIPRIMREVCARDPEIICHVVGAYDPNLEKKLAENIEAEGLTEHVILEGFHADVTPFYEKSALFLMTSRYEGFPLTLFEAAAYGLPTVLYEMPWLSYNDLIDGAIAVPQRDASAAAEAIVRIVNDPEEWQRRSDAIYNSALRYEKTDITAYWTSLIESLEKGTFPDKPRFDRDTEILLDQIDEFHDNAVSSLMQQRDRERERAKNLERKLKSRERELKSREGELKTRERELKTRDRELESIKGSVSFRLGRALTWGPRKVRGLVRCCREHDAKYTFERILYHLHLGPDNDRHDR